jgi:hypothetical protein
MRAVVYGDASCSFNTLVRYDRLRRSERQPFALPLLVEQSQCGADGLRVLLFDHPQLVEQKGACRLLLTELRLELQQLPDASHQRKAGVVALQRRLVLLRNLLLNRLRIV